MDRDKIAEQLNDIERDMTAVWSSDARRDGPNSLSSAQAQTNAVLYLANSIRHSGLLIALALTERTES